VEASLADGGLDAAILDGVLGHETVLPLADWLEELGVPFVFASGYGDNLERGKHAAVPVLAKPFNAGALIAALQAVMAQR
jgi:FixJ family two-component response regulator